MLVVNGMTTDSTAKKRQRLMVIDGHAMIHRAYHAVPETLTTKKGEVINATFGFTSLLIKALNEIKPEAGLLPPDRAARIAVGTVASELAAGRGIIRVAFCCFAQGSADHHATAFPELGLA